MDRLRVSILGAGKIAATMADTLSRMDDVIPYAVAARDLDRAQSFASQYGFEKAYGSYEEMLRDDGTDLVYIATPHSHHYQHALLCLNHGRHVLCEKAFTVNRNQAEEVFALAEQKGLLITEAVWTRYMPFARKLRELLDSGVLGTLCSLEAGFGFELSWHDRLVDPALAGGALLDLGIYPLTFAAIAFGGDLASVTSRAVKTDRGVDAQNSMVLEYRDGKIATLTSSMVCNFRNEATVYGTKGHLTLKDFWHAEEIRVYVDGEDEPRMIPAPVEISGYEYEVRACAKAIAEKKTECPELPHAETLRMMGLMDSLREAWGVRYPME
ncbi:Gfo/Idh/MocA family oxidoreductase [Clostridium sp. D33t1_170424_F3]|uniref:Gfo/Idh/MocA family protein n=1 Tax=Clostridium sp. D33t1_170424_F3 TaxID=2787099 RepID=UPI00336AD9D8